MTFSESLKTTAQRADEQRLAADEQWVRQRITEEATSAERVRRDVAIHTASNLEDYVAYRLQEVAEELIYPLDLYHHVQQKEALSRALCGLPPKLEGIEDEDYNVEGDDDE